MSVAGEIRLVLDTDERLVTHHNTNRCVEGADEVNRDEQPDENVESDGSVNMADSDDDDDGWDEAEEPEEPIQCLFCDTTVNSVQLGIEHLKSSHQFDLTQIKQQFDLDQYSYIKMINYIRTESAAPAVIQAAREPLWSDEAYLKPARVDSWLMFGEFPEEFCIFCRVSLFVFPLADVDELPSAARSESTEKTDSQRVEELERLVQEKNKVIECLAGQIEQMKSSFRSLLGAEGETAEAFANERVKPQTFVGEVPIGDDEGYFNTYSHFDIHHDMLSVSEIDAFCFF